MKGIVVFSGHAHPDLARGALPTPEGSTPAPSTTTTFSNGLPRRGSSTPSCRSRPTEMFIVQPLAPPVQHHLMELLLMLDAARGASAARITAVIPHFAYARSGQERRRRRAFDRRAPRGGSPRGRRRRPSPRDDAAFAAGARILQRAGPSHERTQGARPTLSTADVEEHRRRFAGPRQTRRKPSPTSRASSSCPWPPGARSA